MESLDLGPEVWELHRSARVADVHTHGLINATYLRRDLARRHSPPVGYNPFRNHVDLPRAREGGVKVLTFTSYVPANPLRPKTRDLATLRCFDAFDRLMERAGEMARPARTYAEVEAAHAEGKIAALLAIEGGHAIEGRLERVEEMRRRGAYYMTLTHFVHNGIAASSQDLRPAPYGLTGFGREVVSEMERVGMLVDVAHCTDRAFEEIVAHARRPLVSTHTGCRRFCPLHRSASDEMIRAIARSGGFVGIIAFPPLLTKRLTATVADVVDSMEHVIGLVGADHVCIGSDMDGYTWTVRGLKDVSELPNLTAEMMRRGWPREDIRKVLGESFLRVFASLTERDSGARVSA
jgi:membrane dipeptidase